jgi:hypothetical protein
MIALISLRDRQHRLLIKHPSELTIGKTLRNLSSGGILLQAKAEITRAGAPAEGIKSDPPLASD